MEKVFKKTRNKVIALSLGFVILILIAVLIAMLINKSASATLRIVVAPVSAKVMIDGEQYQNGTYENMPIGTKHVEITADGFVSEKYQIELVADELTKLYVCLKPVDIKNFVETDEYVVNCSAAKELEGEKEKREFLTSHPITTILPIVVDEYSDDAAKWTSFRVDGGKYDNCGGEFCIKITDISGGNREAAEAMVRRRGFDLNDYEVIYEDKSGGGKAW